jgi:ATP-dependent Lon protease
MPKNQINNKKETPTSKSSKNSKGQKEESKNKKQNTKIQKLRLKKMQSDDSSSNSDTSEDDCDMIESECKKYNTRSTNKNVKFKQRPYDDYDEYEDDDEEYIPSESTEKDDEFYDDEEEDEDDDEEDEEDEEGEEDEEDYEDEVFSKKNPTNFSIFFTIDPTKYEMSDEDEETDTENEDDLISSSSEDETLSNNQKRAKITNDMNDTSKIITKYTKYKKDTKHAKNTKHAKDTNYTKDKKNKKNKNKSEDENESEDENDLENKKYVDDAKNVDDAKDVEDTDDKIYNENEIIEILEKMNKSKNSELVSECINLCKEKMLISKKKQDKKNKKEKDRNERIFKKIMYDKNTMNDFTFFKKIELSQQKKIIKELREINKIIRSEKPYRLTLLESDIPTMFKAAAMKKIGLMQNMDVESGEYYKVKNWVDTFMKIPFGIYKTLPIELSNGIENCTEFMEKSQKILDDAVYGLSEAKMQIMQLLGQLITNPSAIGSAIGIHGSPGVGKTKLAKEGISNILGRPFAFIALGGATDSSFLEGHSYTYEGSTWGKIVQILIDSQCMNPVIYFDELDKVSETPKGDEIIGILTHLIDTSQNNQFHDKYFAEIDFDLSKCLFIFTYNDESKINPILRDRMYKIQIKNYNKKEKNIIANDYLLPKIREQVKFDMNDILFPDEIIQYIIDNYCGKEDGVRNLKRCLEIIHTKLNLCRLVKPNSTIFEENTVTQVNFPLTITKDIVDKLIKKFDMVNPSLSYMYI